MMKYLNGLENAIISFRHDIFNRLAAEIGLGERALRVISAQLRYKFCEKLASHFINFVFHVHLLNNMIKI